MIGKASDIGNHFIDGDFIHEIEAKIVKWLDGNKDLYVIDIRHQMMQCKDSDFLYHTAQIIYKVPKKTCCYDPLGCKEGELA